jgi:lysophospholipase L1-like esterase
VRSLAGVLLALLLMEGLVRQVYQRPLAHHPDFGPTIRPGARVVWRIEGNGISHWTDHGVRGTEPVAPGEAPLLVLGSSQTEALQVDDDEVYTAVVEAELRRRGLAARVRNAGRSGASAADYAAWAPVYRRLFAPRHVVIQLAPADLGEDAWGGPGGRFERRAGGTLAATPRPVARPAPWRETLAPLVNRSMLLVYGAYRFAEFRAAQAAQPPLFSAGESRPAPVPAPTPAFPVEEELDLLQARFDGRVSFVFTPDVAGEPGASAQPAGDAERRFQEWCRARGARCANARPAFEALLAAGRSPFGFANTRFGQGHLNREGHRAVAEALLGALPLDELR